VEVEIVVASIAVIIAIVGVVISGKLTRDSNIITRKSNEANILFKFEEKFLAENVAKLQLLISGKKSLYDISDFDTNKALYDYLSIYEMIYNFLKNGLVTKESVLQLYVESLKVALEHPDVKKYIQIDRDTYHNAAWNSVYQLQAMLK